MTDPQERVAVTLGLLVQAAREAGYSISGDLRVSEQHAALLMGCAPDTLAKKRKVGRADSAPKAYKIGLGGCRVSYKLLDIALFIESRRDIFDDPQ